MNRLMLCAIIVSMFISGCARDKDADEPEVNTQVLFQTSLDMENWFINVRFVNHICIEASQAISDIMTQRQPGQSAVALETLMNHFKMPNGLVDSLNEYLEKMRREEARLDAISDKDIRVFDNLRICNTLLTRFIELISVTPATHEVFLDQRETIQKQLDSLIGLLLVEYPLSAEEFNAMTSIHNNDYRMFIQKIKTAPVHPGIPADDIEYPDIVLPSPTPTIPPLVTWRDHNGNIHMGYNPPEGVEILRRQVQEPDLTDPVTTPIPEDTPGDTQTMFWIDKEGVTHMGHQVPDGYEGRPVREIPLMIGD